MLKILSVLSLFFTIHTALAVPPVPIIGSSGSANAGGINYSLPSTPILLGAMVNTASRYSTLSQINAAGGYQVTAGKTLKCRSLMVGINSGGSTTSAAFSYGDNEVGIDNASAPTNVVYRNGGVSSYMFSSSGLNSNTYYLGDALTFPATKYPTVRMNAAGTVYLVCFEI
jgi:hypothetical protein